MTSTSFNIGLSNDKNSSRVLRPPGGGHSDIFGLRDNQNDLVTPSKRKNHPTSTIGGCFTMADSQTEQKEEKQNGSAVNGDNPMKEEETNEVDIGIDENKAPADVTEEKQEKTEEQPNPTPKRGRVPPGGYSTALW